MLHSLSPKPLNFTDGGVDIVYDAQFGSTGKGKVAGWLAHEVGKRPGEKPYSLSVVVASPNSGHTVTSPDGSFKTALQQVPCAAVSNPEMRVLLAPGSLIDVPMFIEEVNRLGLNPSRIGIDAAAGIVEHRHIEAERAAKLGARIGSTMHGVGQARSDRMLRNLKLAHEVEELKPYITNVFKEVHEAVLQGKAVLVEGGQGTFLSHNMSGPDGKPFYPFCTSRVCTVAGFMADTLLSPKHIRNTIGVVRTYPIRVAGNSGPFYAKELDWAEVSRRAGFVEAVEEKTTVTKLTRRVAEMSWELLRLSNAVNCPDAIALTFIDYIDSRDAKKERWEDLTEQSMKFVRDVETEGGVPVFFIGTGPEHKHVVTRF